MTITEYEALYGKFEEPNYEDTCVDDIEQREYELKTSSNIGLAELQEKENPNE